MRNNMVFLKQITGKGRGVMAARDLAAHTLIETAPVIVMEAKDRLLLDQTLLHDYIFEWGESKTQCCMALGLVPMYNHSNESNCEYFMNYEDETIDVKTMQDVKAGDELTINYNGNWNDQSDVWFAVTK